MTTIVGIRATDDIESIVLASDTTSTIINTEQPEQVYVYNPTKKQTQKIYIDDRSEFAVAMAGTADPQFYLFLNKLLRGDINLADAIKKELFPELFRLNGARTNFKQMEPNNTNALMFATRYANKPKLYICHPLGRIEEISQYAAIGSGAEFAMKYMASCVPAIPPLIKATDAIEMASEGIESANQDLFTGGLDLCIVTPDKIRGFGQEINSHLKLVKLDMIEEIKQRVDKVYDKRLFNIPFDPFIPGR